MPTTSYPVSPALLSALNRAEVQAQAAASAAEAVLRTIQVATLDGVTAPEGTTVAFKDGAFIVTTPDAPADDKKDEGKKDDGPSTPD